MTEEERKIALNFLEALSPTKYQMYQQGRADEQEFVEKKCKELGIDYTLIFTCDSADKGAGE